jgi:hypothetical protein
MSMDRGPVAEPGARLTTRISRLLAVTYMAGLLGVAAELLLIGHYEDWRQLLPLALIVLALLTAIWRWRRPDRLASGAFQLVLGAMAASGLAGFVLHYLGNREFEVERDPALSGFRLFAESMTGATPALAPGTMVLLAMVGWVYLASTGSASREQGKGPD